MGRTELLRGRLLGLFVCVLALSAKSLSASENWGVAQGPLGGRNLHAPHVPWFSFPAESAKPLAPGTIRAGIAIYLLNAFVIKNFDNDVHFLAADRTKLNSDSQNELTLVDYEATVAEISFDLQAFDSWRFSADWRMHFRYGGFFDGFIERWHGTFGLPNGGREYFDRNRSYWSIRSEIEWKFNGSAYGLGDLDLQAIWSFWDTPKLSLAAHFAFKVPTGNKEIRFSSGYPDIGAAFLLDWRPWKRWDFYLSNGIVIPLAGEGRLMIQAIPAVEFRINPYISILVQLNIQSASFNGQTRFTHTYLGRINLFSLPQTNLKIGLKGHVGRFGWQAYIEEDMLTWEGADILFYLGVNWSFEPLPMRNAVSQKEQSLNP